MRPRKPEVRAARIRRRRSEAKGDSNANDDHHAARTERHRGDGHGDVLASGAAQLMARMRRRSEERRRAEVRVGEREGWIKARYADNTVTGRFDKNDVLAELIAETKSSFLKLDQELTEDHNIATERLHAAVFAHTTDFLQLFRHVNKASTLVESLKSRVQGIKSAISVISKFSTYSSNSTGTSANNTGNNNEVNNRVISEAFNVSVLCSGANNGGSPFLFGGTNTNSSSSRVKTHARPSLISLRLTRWNDSSSKTFVNNTGAESVEDDKYYSDNRRNSYKVGLGNNDSGVHGDNINNNNNNINQTIDSHSAGAGRRNMSNGGTYLSLTTRSLNTSSLRLWRDSTLSGGGDTSGWIHHQRHLRLDADKKSGMPSSQEIALFVEVLRDELLQILAGRRYLEAAELLRGMEETAVAHGCLPLLLRLEELLVMSIRTHLLRVPMPLMYSESLHIPLVQLLLRLGRVHSGTQLFFQLHAAWVDGEMDKLQSRMDPFYGALIASDYLVGAVQEVLLRQQNLRHIVSDTPDGTHNDGDKEEKNRGRGGKVVHKLTRSSSTSTTMTTTVVTTNRNGGCKNNDVQGGRDNGHNDSRVNEKSKHNGMPRMPPSSAAVLWVRERVDKLAREVLGTRALSYGIGAEGGDPSRFRRAVRMIADAIRTVRRMDDEGYAGCDTHLLRLLTPILVYLQSDFSICTDRRLESTGRAMVDHLIQDVQLTYKTCEAGYNPKLCGDVTRRNNHGCRELHQRLKQLPRTSYTVLLEFLLAPASSNLFKKESGGGGAESSTQSLSLEKYGFLRYANGCTRVHELLLLSLIRFVASMTGEDTLPLECVDQEQTQELTKELRENQQECVSFLVSNALVIESLDITMQRLFLSFLRMALRQRQALVTFVQSTEFVSMHRQLFHNARESTTSPSSSLSSLSVSSSTLLTINSPSSFSPSRWLLGAMQLLLADVLSASVWVAFLSHGGALSYMLRDAALTFRSQYLEELRRLLPPIVQGWMAATLSLAHTVDAARDLLIGDGAPLLSSEGDDSAADITKVRRTSTVAAAASYVADGNGSRDAAAQLLQSAVVNEERLTPFLLNLVQKRFAAHTGRGDKVSQLSAPPLTSYFSSPSSLPSLRCIRLTLGNYPQFPIGGDFDHTDELFLFHWCVQISLNTLSFFQECLILPSHVLNEGWEAEHGAGAVKSLFRGVAGTSQYPLRGCVSPQEESVLEVLAAGGGNYASGVALLQFIVFRLLRDVLCRVETWSVVYGLPMEKWRHSQDILRQQVFFFSLFVRLWSPLFVGGSKLSPSGGPALSNWNNNVDGVPALAILQWLGCGTKNKEGQKDFPAQQQQQQQQQQQRTCSFDVEGLAFYSAVVPTATTASVSQVTGTWRNRKDNNNGSSTRNEERKQEQNAGENKSTPALDKNSQPVSKLNNDRNSTTAKGKENDCGFSLLLLDVIGSFFDTLRELRALPAITSEVTKVRVEKVLTSVDLTDFVGKARLDESDGDDDDDEEYDDDDSIRGSGTGTHTPWGDSENRLEDNVEEPPTQNRVTLQHIRDLLVYYLAPLL